MPSVGLGGIARGGARMDKRGVASRLYGGEYGRLPRTGNGTKHTRDHPS